ncbi:MAG: alpha/beta hydrolase [Halieaceae bacterium]|jgi:pimeloyl-ACP methyl ester carboxylesterase|nr:alpha/beta hydrolase [Halieaceae bacterium]
MTNTTRPGKPFAVVSLVLLCATLFAFPNLALSGEDSVTPYGDNSAVGKYATVNNIEMYYEIYGEGEPMVLIHGSGQSIAAMKHQIAFFASKYQVIVVDSRAHGKSGLGEGPLNYRQMASDMAALLSHIGVKKTRLVGWSDGGIIGLLLAIEHPQAVAKLATMGANLQPDTSAIYPWAVEWVADQSQQIDQMLATGDTTQNWALLKQHFYLLREQPNISLKELGTISVPVLVMAGDRDIIREEHTLKIYQNLQKAHLAIFPGETHFTPETNPALFNTTVDKFMSQPFTRPNSSDML